MCELPENLSNVTHQDLNKTHMILHGAVTDKAVPL